jgi:hypothetical protein
MSTKSRCLSIMLCAVLVLTISVSLLSCSSGQATLDRPTELAASPHDLGNPDQGKQDQAKPRGGVSSTDPSDAVSSILNDAWKAILGGGESAIGGQIMGAILAAAGWGGSDQQEAAAFDQMNQKLDQIKQSLTILDQNLQKLESDLKIVEAEIVANITAPADAIAAIDEARNKLAAALLDDDGTLVAPGEADKAEIADFASLALENHRIYTAWFAIYAAIVPDADSHRQPILDTYTDQLISQLSAKGLTNCYDALEKYFSALLYHQMLGQDLVLEAQNAQKAAAATTTTTAPSATSTAGLAARATGGLTEDDTKYFVQHELPQEVGSFMNNVYRLVLAGANLADSKSFLPADTQYALDQADFFRTQVLGEGHFGLRGTIVATQDVAGSVLNLTARDASGKTYAGQGTLCTVTGQPYDHWSGNTLQSSTDYSFIGYDFGDVPAGTYTIQADPASGLPVTSWSAVVQNYDSSTHKLSPTGDTAYGSIVMPLRWDSSVHFTWGSATDQIEIGDVVVNVASGKPDISITGHEDDSISFNYFQAGVTNSAEFRFGGGTDTTTTAHATPVTIDFSATVTGNVDCTWGWSGGHITYQISVTDQTTSSQQAAQGEDQDDDASVEFTNQGSVTGKLNFSAQPNHTYLLTIRAFLFGTNSMFGQTTGEVSVTNFIPRISF